MGALLEADVRDRRETRTRGGVALLTVLIVLAWAGPPAATLDPKPLVLVANVDALIHPVSAEFMAEAINRAEAEGAALVVSALAGASARSSLPAR